jgi:hypothetical protein
VEIEHPVQEQALFNLPEGNISNEGFKTAIIPALAPFDSSAAPGDVQ